MATTFVTTVGAPSVNPGVGDVVFVIEGASITTTGFGINGLADIETIVHGSIFSGATGINLGDNSGVVDTSFIAIGETGVVSASSFGIFADADTNYIKNSGEITAVSGSFSVDAIAIQNQLILENSGTIKTFGGMGVDINGGTVGLVHEIVNSGLISGAFAGVDLTTDSLRMTNSGTIIGGGDGLRASSGTSVVTLTNSGTIIGADESLDLGAAADRVVNTATGSLDGDVDLNGGANVLSNFGQILGDINAGSSADTIFSSGLIRGVLDTGSGDDLVQLGGEVFGSVLLGDGADIVSGVGSVVVTDGIFGGAGNDTMTGGGGRDLLFGGENDDIVFGGAGDDLVAGEAGNDILRGGSGDDELLGGAGVDVLFGGSGADIINGSAGRDIMRGGEGEDTFVFDETTDSVVTTGQTDVILNFQRGLDVIDLFALTPADLSFVGTAAFTGAGNEVRYVVAANGTAVVQVDLDGNSVEDMRIFLRSIDTLEASDFIL